MSNTKDITIPPGSYRLDADLVNPEPDRRHKTDWRKLPVWEAGTEFVVREQRRMGEKHMTEVTAGLPLDVVQNLHLRDKYTVVELAGDRHSGLRRVGPGHDKQYAALAANLVPCSESMDQFLTRIECGDGFAEWLVAEEYVKRSDLEAWWRRYMYGDPGIEEVTPNIVEIVENEVSTQKTIVSVKPDENVYTTLGFCIKCGVDVDATRSDDRTECPNCGFDTVTPRTGR